MSEPLHFRSAFNGFNREDVVRYIEYLSSNHENHVKQLQADLAAAQQEIEVYEDERDSMVEELKDQLTQQETAISGLNVEKDALQAKCDQLEAQLATDSTAQNASAEKYSQLETTVSFLTAENTALATKVAQLEAQLATANAEKDAVFNARPAMSAYVEEELAAYRRAERVERMANERAKTIYRKLRIALQETTFKADQTATNLDSLASQISAQLDALRDSLYSSRTSLDQSIASLDDICPQQIDC